MAPLSTIARATTTLLAFLMVSHVPAMARAQLPETSPLGMALAPPQPGAPRASATASDEPTSDEPAPDEPIPEAVAPTEASSELGPIIHVIDARPDPERGVLKLARYVNSASAQSGNVIHVTVNYQAVCTLPCGVPVDNSERPLFFFIRDGSPISKGFRIPAGADVFTIKFDAGRPRMFMTGIYLTVFFIYPVGIPLWIVGKSRMWIASGAPSETSDFVRLKKAKL